MVILIFLNFEEESCDFSKLFVLIVYFYVADSSRRRRAGYSDVSHSRIGQIFRVSKILMYGGKHLLTKKPRFEFPKKEFSRKSRI